MFLDYSIEIKLPKLNCRICGTSALRSNSDARQYVRRAFGYISPAEHVQRRDDAIKRANAIYREHRKIVDTEFKAIFGRVPTLADYKISGIWRDEFSDEVKNRLRALNSDCAAWTRIAYLHNNCLFKKTGKIDRCF